jgi:predicted permease
MRWFTQLRMRLSMLFQRNSAAAQLDRELRFHLEQQIRENVVNGMSPRAARRAALRTFGNPGVLREEARATWSWNWLESLLRDFRYGTRTLRRTPGFAIISILVMALGIGANVALFTVVRSVLLKPLPFRDPDRLMRLYERTLDDRFPFNQSAAGVYAEWKKENKSFTALGICGYAGYNLSGTAGQLPETVRAATFSWDFLPLLGVQPALGRNFGPADDRPSAQGTVLLSWGLWKRRFDGDPAQVGRVILLDAKPYTVIGVMPAWFAYPEQAIQLWTPVYYKENPKLMAALDDHDFRAIGRLRDGVTPHQAVTELSLITKRLHDEHSDNPYVSSGANIRPMLDSIVGDVKTPLYVLLAATGCVLLIACLNVANLLVARSEARRKEMAIRTAMGGSRLRLLRERLMESLLLSVFGGALGLLLAQAAVAWLVGLRQDMTRVEAVHIDWVVVAFAAGLVLLCALFAGLISATGLARHQPFAVLQEASRAGNAGHARGRLRQALLALEVALTVVLLIASGLLLKTYQKLRSDDIGCITRNVLTMSFALPQQQYNLLKSVSFFQTLLARIRNSPGVHAAGLIFPVLPGDGYGGDSGFTIAGRPPLPAGRGQLANHRWADPGYFSAIGIPILRGHTFDETERPGHATEVMISDAFAREYFPGEDPVGQHMVIRGSRRYQIVGIVGDTRLTAGEPPHPMMYFSIYASDSVDATEFINGATLVIRSNQDVTQFALLAQKIFEEMDRDLPVSDILTMDQVIGRNTLDASFDATLLLAFAILSVILAAVGLFGVLSYIVTQRTAEIGIRIALGAQRKQVLRLVLVDGLRPALLGLVLGLAASAGLTQLIESMLYGTQPLDPVIFFSVSLLLLLVAAIACAAPAWQASRLDPMQALRSE